MKYSRMIRGAVVTTLLVTGGCASFPEKWGETAPSQKQVLSLAVAKLQEGEEREARSMLEQVLAAAPVVGVTDEALFRLALLSLREDTPKGNAKTQKLLEQLSREHPTSAWNHQAAPLAAHLTDTKRLRESARELRALREQNYSLSKDNRDLRQTLERLKSLDLELEQKIRR